MRGEHEKKKKCCMENEKKDGESDCIALGPRELPSFLSCEGFWEHAMR